MGWWHLVISEQRNGTDMVLCFYPSAETHNLNINGLVYLSFTDLNCDKQVQGGLSKLQEC